MSKKKGSSLVVVLVLVSALLITGSAVASSLVNTSKFNAKYNEVNDLELAAESGVNIGKNYLVNEVNEKKAIGSIENINQINHEISSNYIDTIITDNEGINYNLTIEKLSESTDVKGIYLVKCDAEKGGVTKSKEERVVININSSTTDGGTDEDTNTNPKPSLPDDLVLTPGFLTQQSYNVSHMNSLSSSSSANWSDRTHVFRDSYGNTTIKSADVSTSYNDYAGNFENDKTTSTIFTEHTQNVSNYKEAKKVWGYIKVDFDGEYRFSTEADDGIMLALTVDGVRKTLIDNFKPKGWNPPDIANQTVYLKKDVYYPIYIEYFNWGGNARFLLKYALVNGNSKLVYNKVPSNWCYPSNNPIPPTESENNNNNNGDLSGILDKEVALIIPSVSKINNLNHLNGGIILTDDKKKYDNYNSGSGAHNNMTSISGEINISIPNLNIKNTKTNSFYLSSNGITESINGSDYYKINVSSGSYEIKDNYNGFIVVMVNGNLEIYGQGNAQNINKPIIFVVNGIVSLNGNQGNNIQSMAIMANKIENKSSHTIGFNSGLLITKELTLPNGHINRWDKCKDAIKIINKIINGEQI